MNLVNKILELEDGIEYYILKEIFLNKKQYLYAIAIKNSENICFFEIIQEKLYRVKKDDLLKELLMKVNED